MSDKSNNELEAISPLIFLVAGAEDEAEDVDASWDDLGEAPVRAEVAEEPLCGECHTADDDVVQDDVGDAFQTPRELPEPKAPSRAAARRHALTHWSYAVWWVSSLCDGTTKQRPSLSEPRRRQQVNASLGIGLLFCPKPDRSRSCDGPRG